MKKAIAVLLVICLVLSAVPAFAAPKGASARALERASDQSVFNRTTDWFATRGKNDQEKAAILVERKAKRAAKRAEKEVKKQKKIMEKEAKKAQKATKAKMKKGFKK